MTEALENMQLAELGIVAIAFLVGLAVGYAVRAIRQFLHDHKFKVEEKFIAGQIRRMNLGEIRELSENGRLTIAPAMKTLLSKIDRQLLSIDIYHRERAEIEDDIDDLSGTLQQLANA